MSVPPTSHHRVAPPSTEEDWRAFREERESGLRARHGILSQVALRWLEPGAAPTALDGLPGLWSVDDGRVGVAWTGDEVELLVGPEQAALEETADGWHAQATSADDLRLVAFGDDRRIDVIHRGIRTGLRVLDPAAPRRTGFDGVPTYPFDARWAVTGTFAADPREVLVGSALPWLQQRLPSPGVATLDLGDGPVELRVTGSGAIAFTDETSGEGSADWRFVPVEIDGDAVRADFNRALNFPSAFSRWGTCPRPPLENHVPLRVAAGERRVEPTER